MTTTVNLTPHTTVNLTPHAITLNTGVGVITFPPSGTVARVTSTNVENTLELVLHGVRTTIEQVVVEYGGIENLPKPSVGTLYLVSGMVFDRTDRSDVVAPDTGPTANRNEAGHIVSVNRLRFNSLS